jgi:hypothetical protein
MKRDGRADSDGKGAGKNVAALPNPAIDARSLAQLLRDVGVDVMEGANRARARMTERLLQFGRRRAVFFAVAWRHDRWRGDPGLKPVVGTPICEQQIG